jgi:cation diffusion facilitator CzcD-associated flavoprotein CzcO
MPPGPLGARGVYRNARTIVPHPRLPVDRNVCKNVVKSRPRDSFEGTAAGQASRATGHLADELGAGMASALDSSDLTRAVNGWLTTFAGAIERSDLAAAVGLLCPDVYWRDLLAVTWDVHTFYGADQVGHALGVYLHKAKLSGLRLNQQVEPRRVVRAGISTIEALVCFEVAAGHGQGVIRLIEPDGPGKLVGWTIMTALERLAGLPRFRKRRDERSWNDRDFAGPNWQEQRLAEARFTDRQPAVLVVGAGQAGLAVAARLRQLDVDTLVVDRHARVGDNWRHRYHSLVLHNEVWANHLPYLPFPETFPTYIPKDLLADWFESYAEFTELNVWTSTEFVAASFDATSEQWTVRLRSADGRECTLSPRHIVMASGVSGIPYQPAINGFEAYQGEVFHTSTFNQGARFAGKRVIIIGSGTSGHDVAQDLWSHGAQVTLVQRSATTVVTVGPDAAGQVYSIYRDREGYSTDVADLINIATPYPVLRHSYQLLTAELEELDRDLHTGLKSIGFKLDYGTDNTGFQMKYLRRGGGYYLDVGCSQLLIDREVGLIQFSDIASFTSTGLQLEDGSVLEADAVVFATGYLGQQELVRRLFGDATAEKVGPIWGFDDEGELRNMWRRTAQTGLWFTAGSLAQCRIYSKYLALQIKAREAGTIPAQPPAGEPRGVLRDIDLTDLISSPA